MRNERRENRKEKRERAISENWPLPAAHNDFSCCSISKCRVALGESVEDAASQKRLDRSSVSSKARPRWGTSPVHVYIHIHGTYFTETSH